LLEQISEVCGPGGGLLIGIDLQKDPLIIEAAYNDDAGVTAEFNLNLLHRINRELDASIDVAAFEHRAVYQQDRGRVVLSLVSTEENAVVVGDERIEFQRGETIRTEYSHKYTIPQFESLAALAGMEIHRVWTDPREWFAVVHCAVADAG
ncbi:MAG: L-histidine N(alpha)-methyltransferase, partial [Planctomycetota bacterium]